MWMSQSLLFQVKVPTEPRDPEIALRAIEVAIPSFSGQGSNRRVKMRVIQVEMSQSLLFQVKSKKGARK